MKSLQLIKKAPVALVFGRERTGLTNDELQSVTIMCVFLRILNHSSLNLAMAVQTLSYEVRVAHLDMVASQYQPQQQMTILRIFRKS
ncbi:hypothetical protein O9993_07305 [Vibrio lentus]|nr:hypothetical protein [Vibrio lentus]